MKHIDQNFSHLTNTVFMTDRQCDNDRDHENNEKITGVHDESVQILIFVIREDDVELL